MYYNCTYLKLSVRLVTGEHTLCYECITTALHITKAVSEAGEHTSTLCYQVFAVYYVYTAVSSFFLLTKSVIVVK